MSLLRLQTVTSRAFSTSSRCLKGHSKWQNIRHTKAKQDAIKGNLATKFGNQIATAAKMGGADPAGNIRLATIIEAAKSYNVPKKTIEAAIRRGAGLDAKDKQIEQVFYEGIGPSGVSVIIECLTSNRNGLLAKLNTPFNRAAGKNSGIAFPSTVQFLFTRKGCITIEKEQKSMVAPDPSNPMKKVEQVTVLEFDHIMDQAIEWGAEDVEEDTDHEGKVVSYTLYTDVQDTGAVAKMVQESGIAVADFSISYIANEDTKVDIEDEHKADIFHNFIESIEEIDDVTEVYTNAA
ncbi:putative transcriptional regulatory protein [Yarrowia sp. C11]|nr:putative transcriptional regulatory protein [Yarrowia sp. C11]KAG5370479.1 putative transcriptional regulatory protein [Yarrowia sp. E02]